MFTKRERLQWNSTESMVTFSILSRRIVGNRGLILARSNVGWYKARHSTFGPMVQKTTKCELREARRFQKVCGSSKYPHKSWIIIYRFISSLLQAILFLQLYNFSLSKGDHMTIQTTFQEYSEKIQLTLNTTYILYINDVRHHKCSNLKSVNL